MSSSPTRAPVSYAAAAAKNIAGTPSAPASAPAPAPAPAAAAASPAAAPAVAAAPAPAPAAAASAAPALRGLNPGAASFVPKSMPVAAAPSVAPATGPASPHHGGRGAYASHGVPHGGQPSPGRGAAMMPMHPHPGMPPAAPGFTPYMGGPEGAPFHPGYFVPEYYGWPPGAPMTAEMYEEMMSMAQMPGGYGPGYMYPPEFQGAYPPGVEGQPPHSPSVMQSVGDEEWGQQFMVPDETNDSTNDWTEQDFAMMDAMAEGAEDDGRYVVKEWRKGSS